MKVLVTGDLFPGRKALCRPAEPRQRCPGPPTSPPRSPTLSSTSPTVTDYSSVLAAVSGCDAVFHVAALVEPWLPYPSRFISVNVGGLENVLRAVRESRNVRKVHHEKFLCTEYEKSKLMANKIAQHAASVGKNCDYLLFHGMEKTISSMTSLWTDDLFEAPWIPSDN